ncbi:MAG: ComF family protein [Corallococcus sp.]|nr:ComF family protein [Corallococcus sp.]
MNIKNFKSKFEKFVDKFADILAPVDYSCMSCGREIFNGLGFCDDCLKTVVFNNGKTCRRCGVGIDGDEDYCGNCAFDKVYFDKSYAAFSYEGAVQHAILQMKFKGQGRYAKVFAKYLAYLAVKNNIQFDLVCFPPMSAKSKRERTYNQSQLLAKYFCDMMDCDNKLLDAFIKVKETERQEELNKSERKQNLIGAYKVVANVTEKQVLIIDDVKTTGATLNECAKILKRKGATSVVGLMVSARKENIPYEID